MWTHEESIESTATPAIIWKLFEDVPGWKRWNAGIERIELHGAFAEGTRFTMQPPGSEAFTSTLTRVVRNEVFTDETVIDGTRIVVEHCLIPMSNGGTRIVYRTRIDGESAAAFGPMVTGDFAEVLALLKALAESGSAF